MYRGEVHRGFDTMHGIYTWYLLGHPRKCEGTAMFPFAEEEAETTGSWETYPKSMKKANLPHSNHNNHKTRLL